MGNQEFFEIKNQADFEEILQSKDAVLAYFSTRECSVCHVLKPKVAQLVDNNFPQMQSVFCEMNDIPGLSAKYSVFTAPTLLVFFAGKEYIRKSRSFSLDELRTEIDRIYQRMFA